MLTGCSTVRLSGTSSHQKIEGVYTRLSNGCYDGHNVYYNADVQSYLYYFRLASGESTWAFGAHSCSRTGYVMVITEQLYPESVTGDWLEAGEVMQWHRNEGISVDCHNEGTS